MRRGVEPACRAAGVAVAAAFVTIAIASTAGARPLPRGLHVHGALGVGFDTNALRFDSGTPAAAYLPYAGTAAYEFRPARRTEARLQASAAGRAYSDAAPGAREVAYGARLRVVQRLWGETRGRAAAPGLDLILQPYWNAERSVYTSHRLHREILRLQRAHDGEPRRRISLGGRYDADDWGAEVGLDWRGPRGTKWSVEYEAVERNYRNDYRWVGLVSGGVVANPVQRYDYTGWALRLGTEQPLGRGFSARARYWHDRTQWLRRASRYVDGFLVLDPSVFQSQRFDTDVLRTELRWERGRRLECSVAPAWSWRQDHAWGYWDSAQWSLETAVRYRPRPHLELAVEYHYEHRDYSTARVDFSAPVLGKPLLDDFPRSLVLEAGVRVARHGSLVGRYEYDNVGDANPVFAYERSRVAVGYEFRY